MDKQRFLQLVQDYYNGVTNKELAYELIYQYCIEKGKDKSATEIFVNFVTSFSNPVFNPFLNKVMDTIIRDYSVKYELIELHEVLPNGRTKLITIY